ncbi:unnamed protein product [Symbiodinium sp. CCMP2592]|nr:unnamed protein product [Symbiodinium sp. CCMP2592]
MEVGPHTFPRDWPDVYSESDALRALLRRRGPCASKRVSVVPLPEEEHLCWADGLEVWPLQSRRNAEAAAAHAGLALVEGWAIYDLLDDVTGAAFVAERYWWNATEDGTWVDFSPRPENMEQLLLAEALAPAEAREAREATVLTAEAQDLAEHLAKLRFPKARRAGRRSWRVAAPEPGSPAKPPSVGAGMPTAHDAQVSKGVEESPKAEAGTKPEEVSSPETDQAPQEVIPPSPAEATAELLVAMPLKMEAEQAERLAKIPPLSAEESRTILKRIRECDLTAIAEAAERAEDDDSCIRLITTGLSGALVQPLRRGATTAFALLAQVARRSMEMAAGGAQHKTVAESLMSSDGLQPLVDAIASPDIRKAGLAAEALGYVCYRHPVVQARAGRAGAIRSLVRLLGRRAEGAAREAAYALWNIQVGQRDHAATAFREGAAAVLLPILSATLADEVLINALGALTSLLLAAGAQEAIGANGAVEVLCDYLEDDHSLAVRERALAALANLLSGHGENCRKAVYRAMAIPRLMRFLEVSPDGEPPSLLGAENAAAALANIVATTGPMAAQTAVDAGILQVVSQLLQSSARPAQAFGLLANLSWQLPELGENVYQMTPIQRVVDVLKPHEDQPPRGRLAALALAANLASLGPAKARLLRAGLLKPMVTVIESSGDPALKDMAGVGLANILEDSPESVAKVFLEIPDLPRRLAFLLTNKKQPLETSTRRHLMRAIALLASREASRVSVKESGAPEALLALMDQSGLAREASRGLLNLAPVAKDRDKLLKKGILPKLVTLLRSPDARDVAAGALANLTAGSKAAAVEAARLGALSLLAPQLKQACEPQDENMIYEVLGFAENDAPVWILAAIAHIVDLVDTPGARRDAGAAVPCMCLLTCQGEGSVKELGIFALGAMAKSPELLRPAVADWPGLREACAAMSVSPLLDRAKLVQRCIPAY